MNKLSVFIYLLVLSLGAFLAHSSYANNGDIDEKNSKSVKHSPKEKVILASGEFNSDDFFGSYGEKEVIKRTIPQKQSAVKKYLMQAALWGIMKLDDFYSIFCDWKKRLALWLWYGKRKA